MELSFSKFDHHKNLKGQRELFRECFPETIGTSVEKDSHYFWKFHAFPGKEKSYEYAAWVGGDMVGYYAAIPYRYRCGDKMFTAGMVCDVMTGLKARGKGVFTRLGHYSTDAMQQEGLDFVTGYPIRPEVIPGHLKVNWKIAFKMPIYIRFLKTNSVLKKYKAGFLSRIVNVGLLLFDRVFVARHSREYTLDVHDKTAFFKLKDYEQFFEQWQSEIGNPLQKTMDFMRWRLGAPGTSYQIITARKDGKLVGMAIVRKSEMEQIPVIAILDLMVLPGNEKCISGINHEFRLLAETEKAEAVVAMMGKLWSSKYRMMKHGFLKSPYVFSLIIKNLNKQVDDGLLYDESRWHLMWIDSDDL
jgi:hypothetical protein